MSLGRPKPPSKDLVIGSRTPIGDIVSALAKRGCVDLSSSINLAACSNFPHTGGGFCDIYQGELQNGLKIAIKSLRVYQGSNVDDQEQRIVKNAARELYHWSKLRHRNVLPLMGLALFRNQLSMVSEWMDNGNLASFLRLNSDLNRMCFCIDISAGLSYIHENGMVHGDLKAANVVVSADGIAMITDFGNAELRDLTLRFSNTPSSHGISVRWAAPELLNTEINAPQASKEADVYAYGVTALEVLIGEIPYKGLSDIQVMRLVAINKEHPARPQVDLDDNIWRMLVRCWDWSPDCRPSITTVSSSLHALHAGCSSHSQHPSLTSSRASQAPTHRGPQSSRLRAPLGGTTSVQSLNPRTQMLGRTGVDAGVDMSRNTIMSPSAPIPIIPVTAPSVAGSTGSG